MCIKSWIDDSHEVDLGGIYMNMIKQVVKRSCVVMYQCAYLVKA